MYIFTYKHTHAHIKTHTHTQIPNKNLLWLFLGILSMYSRNILIYYAGKYGSLFCKQNKKKS